MKRIAASVLALLISLAAGLPVAANDFMTVSVIIENMTFSEDDGAWWEGRLIETSVTIPLGDSAMAAIKAAVDDNRDVVYSIDGIETNYIFDINGLSAFDGGKGSGWMITLNDWFIQVGAGDIQVEDGDVVALMYTTNLGADLSSGYENNDKTLKNLEFNAGKLEKEFSSDIREYTLYIPHDVNSLIVTPTANNKNFQVRLYDITDMEYKRTAAIPAWHGAIIRVVCGRPDWPTLNSYDRIGTEEDPALVPAEEYIITVKKRARILEASFAGGETGLTDGGTLETVTIENPGGAPAWLAVAVYKENTLYGLRGVNCAASGTIPVYLPLPEDVSGAYVKIMLWNSPAAIEALCDYYRIPQQ